MKSQSLVDLDVIFHFPTFISNSTALAHADTPGCVTERGDCVGG